MKEDLPLLIPIALLFLLGGLLSSYRVYQQLTTPPPATATPQPAPTAAPSPTPGPEDNGQEGESRQNRRRRLSQAKAVYTNTSLAKYAARSGNAAGISGKFAGRAAVSKSAATD